MDINFLIFDIGGVLILNDQSCFEKYDEAKGLVLGTSRKVFNECFYNTTKGQEFDVQSYLSEKYDGIISLEQFDEISQLLYKSERINVQLVEFIRNQKGKRNVCALTNNTHALTKLLKDKFHIDDIFDHVFNSAEIGLTKPDPKYFQFVLRKLQCQPEECLFIDDNQENIESARELGFVAITFKTNEDLLEYLRDLLGTH